MGWRDIILLLYQTVLLLASCLLLSQSLYAVAKGHILVQDIDEPDKPHRKYLALDYICTYFPIVDDEIQYPE